MTDILGRALHQKTTLSFNAEEAADLIREHLQIRAMDEISAANAKAARIYWDIDQNQKFCGLQVNMPGPYIPGAK